MDRIYSMDKDFLELMRKRHVVVRIQDLKKKAIFKGWSDQYRNFRYHNVPVGTIFKVEEIPSPRGWYKAYNPEHFVDFAMIHESEIEIIS